MTRASSRNQRRQVVHRALSCPQKNLCCFYTATATESDITSLLKIVCNVKSRAAAALAAVPPEGCALFRKNNNASGPLHRYLVVSRRTKAFDEDMGPHDSIKLVVDVRLRDRSGESSWLEEVKRYLMLKLADKCKRQLIQNLTPIYTKSLVKEYSGT